MERNGKLLSTKAGDHRGIASPNIRTVLPPNTQIFWTHRSEGDVGKLGKVASHYSLKQSKMLVPP